MTNCSGKATQKHKARTALQHTVELAVKAVSVRAIKVNRFSKDVMENDRLAEKTWLVVQAGKRPMKIRVSESMKRILAIGIDSSIEG